MKLDPNTPPQDQVCACGHWYDEHAPAADDAPAYCEGCYQTTAASGGSNTDEDLIAATGLPHEHEFKYDPDQTTPEAIADRGGDPDKWPQHVKDAASHLFANGRYVG